MNLQMLQTFLAIRETGNLIRAADRLNVTQSTVTARLKSLEEILGQQLFIRKKSGAELTSAGFKFERYARLMSNLWRQAREEVSLPKNIDTICNIGCQFDLWNNLGRELVSEIRTTHPHTALSIWPGEQTDIDRWLSTGLVDAALCHAPKMQEGLTIEALSPDELILVSTEKHELMRSDPDYIYVDAGEEFRIQHAAEFADGETSSVVFGSSDWALEYLLKVGGSAYLPQRLAKDLVKNSQLHTVPGARRFNRSIFLVTNNEAASNWPWLTELVQKYASN